MANPTNVFPTRRLITLPMLISALSLALLATLCTLVIVSWLHAASSQDVVVFPLSAPVAYVK